MDVAYLKATNFTALMRGADDKDTPNISGTPLATMGYMKRDEAGHAESEMETDEEQIAVHDEVVPESQEDIIFRDLLNLEEMVVQSATQSVPVEMSTPALSRSGTASMSEATPSGSGTDQKVAPNTDAPTDREMA
uniref:Polyprotein protein n=1 Tax=Solanum tuberosum TaxID=4113 RepID=M1DYS0_SOLTU